jgi:hypothetical protein
MIISLCLLLSLHYGTQLTLSSISGRCARSVYGCFATYIPWTLVVATVAPPWSSTQESSIFTSSVGTIAIIGDEPAFRVFPCPVGLVTANAFTGILFIISTDLASFNIARLRL